MVINFIWNAAAFGIDFQVQILYKDAIKDHRLTDSRGATSLPFYELLLNSTYRPGGGGVEFFKETVTMPSNYRKYLHPGPSCLPSGLPDLAMSMISLVGRRWYRMEWNNNN